MSDTKDPAVAVLLEIEGKAIAGLCCMTFGGAREFIKDIRVIVDGAISGMQRQPEDAAPIDMILHCPACGLQHIDTPEPSVDAMYVGANNDREHAQLWTNPPHRSHLCAGCDIIWRPADVPTNGVAAIKTEGKADTPVASYRKVSE